MKEKEIRIDALKMKRDLQKRLYKEHKGLSVVEINRRIKEKAKYEKMALASLFIGDKKV